MGVGSRQAQIARWMRWLHVYSGMLMMLVLLFFVLTGVLLNHKDWWSSSPQTATRTLPLPAPLLNAQRWQETPQQVGASLWQWLQQTQGLSGQGLRIDSAESGVLLLSVQQPGASLQLEAELATGQLRLEQQKLGLLALLTDLHLGRGTGPAWRLFMDFSALLFSVFTLSGCYLVVPQRKRRGLLFGLCAAGGVLLGVMHAL